MEKKEKSGQTQSDEKQGKPLEPKPLMDQIEDDSASPVVVDERVVGMGVGVEVGAWDDCLVDKKLAVFKMPAQVRSDQVYLLSQKKTVGGQNKGQDESSHVQILPFRLAGSNMIELNSTFPMRWVSALSSSSEVQQAVRETAEKIKAGLQGASPDLCFVFVSPHFRAHYEKISKALSSKLRSRFLFGCTASGIIGEGREVEHRPALSLTAALLPEVEIRAFHLSDDKLPDMDASPKVWRDKLSVPLEPAPHFILLADPFTIRIEETVMGLDYAFPLSQKIGGLASGAGAPGENVLFLNGNLHTEGLIGLALSGNIILETAVAQGCRPIGTDLQVTRCERNILYQLNGKPALEVLEEMISSMDERDQGLVQTSLFLGIAIDPSKKDPERGDFLIRNILGISPEQGAMSVGVFLRNGQTVRFHLRDARTSAEDLELTLNHFSVKKPASLSGALLFSCTGRGEYLYGRPNHDSDLFAKKFKSVPLSGFFCAGEIGPVSKNTYVHGYTSCFGLFRPVK